MDGLAGCPGWMASLGFIDLLAEDGLALGWLGWLSWVDIHRGLGGWVSTIQFISQAHNESDQNYGTYPSVQSISQGTKPKGVEAQYQDESICFFYCVLIGQHHCDPSPALRLECHPRVRDYFLIKF